MLCHLWSSRLRASSPGPAIPARWGVKARGPARWRRILCRRVFPHGPDNLKALRISSNCSAASSPSNSTHATCPGSMPLPAAAVFRHGRVMRGTVAGAGLTQRTLHCRVIHPTGQSIAFFLQPVQVGFHLCDAAGDPQDDCRSSSGEVYPAAPAALSISRSRLLSFSCRAWINASCSTRRCFSRRMSSEEVSF